MVSAFFYLLLGLYNKERMQQTVFSEMYDYEKGFADHYRKFIKPKVEKFESKRLEALHKAKKFLFLFLIGLPLIIAAYMLLLPVLTIAGSCIIILLSIYCIVCVIRCKKDLAKSVIDERGIIVVHKKWYKPIVIGLITIWLFFLFLMGLVALVFYPFVAWVVIIFPLVDYGASIKEEIFPDIISFIGEYHYQPKSGYYLESFHTKSEILPKFNIERSKNSFQGTYQGVSINFFTSHLMYKSNSRDSGKLETVFDGVVVTLSMHKPFKGKTIVKKDRGSVRNFFMKKPSDFERVKLEDSQFEKFFEVFSSDQIEARYLLTTTFMERLLKLADKFGGKGLQCSFFNNSVFIMIPTSKKMFEPCSPFKSQNFIDDSKLLLAEINLMHQIVDILKLNNNIGM